MAQEFSGQCATVGMIRDGGGAPAAKGVQPSSKFGGANLLEEPTQLSAGGEISEFEAGARIPKEGHILVGAGESGIPAQH